MSEYTGNSYKSKKQETDSSAERKKTQKIVTKPVKVKKKGEIRKFTDLFFAEDFGTVKDYLIEDVLIPAGKKLFYDLVTSTADKMLFGGTGRHTQSQNGSKLVYKDYNKSYERRTTTPSTQRRDVFDLENIIISHRGEAEEVLDQLRSDIKAYGFVTVLSFYDAVGLTAPYTSDRYAWTDLSTARIIPVRDGYVIRMPRPAPLD